MSNQSVEVECSSCGGTGVYVDVGFAEKEGCCIVCRGCEGTGKQVLTFTPFERRRARRGMTWVFRYNPGIVVGEGDFGGMSYDMWLAGKPFPPKSEMRKHACPAWWYQGVDYKKKPDWDWCIVCGCFYDCQRFKDKHLCWQRWDAEHKA